MFLCEHFFAENGPQLSLTKLFYVVDLFFPPICSVNISNSTSILTSHSHLLENLLTLLKLDVHQAIKGAQI